MYRLVLRGPWTRPGVISKLPASSVSIPHRAFPAHSIDGRTFTSLTRLQSEYSSQSSSNASSASDQGKEDSSLESENTGSSSHIPWYLQEAPPVSESQQLSSRDHFPALPENPPAILPAFLEYAFKDLGLDDLKLIDLRGLENPPPLGANVIMIIGTARSVKHLNVSADRLCRWLRSTYKLSPYADGLLGRNELKIKLRRKARRARIASQQGAMFDEKDDGITTGWICVNAGVVEKSPVQDQAARSFEGFGEVVGGTRVVVQIFTEEKRAEVDLETLWQRALDREERAKLEYAFEASAKPPTYEVRSLTSVNSSPSDNAYGHVIRPSVSLLSQQTRQLHSGLHSNRRLKTIRYISNNSNAIPSGSSQTQDLRPPTREPGPVDFLFQSLSTLSDEDVMRELGDGPEDRTSTLFLQLFHNKLEDSSAEEIAIAHLNLSSVAISRQHRAYSKESLYQAFEICTAVGYSISDDLGFQVASALLAERPKDELSDVLSGCLPDEDKELALRVLEHLSLRGTNVLTMQVFHMLYKAASLEPVAESRQKISPTRRILRMMDTINLPFDPEQARLLMVTLFENKDYEQFWKIWGKLPVYDSPRTSSDYETLFELHAKAGNSRLAQDCVLAHVPMMKRESPPIALRGRLAQAISDCVHVAEPSIAEPATAYSGMPGQPRPHQLLIQIWDECQKAMETDSMPATVN